MVTPPRHVIVSDDEPDIRLVFRLNLESEGFVVDEAGDAKSLMALATTVEPLVCVILDIAMPGTDGWECLALLRADPKLRSVPVVVVSGQVEEAARKRAIESGASEFVAKPFNPRHIVSIVKRLAGD